jgi:hypothetical protein
MHPPLIFLHIPKAAGTTLRAVLSSRYRREQTFVIGNDINADIHRLIALDEAERHRLRLLMGHMSFGLHRYLAPGARYVSILRDPVERVLSEYRFLKSNVRHPFHHQVREMSLAEYLDSDFTGQSSNGQTRLLSGSHVEGTLGIAGRESLHESHLQSALGNIERHFVITGTQQRFEATLLLLARYLGWRRWPFFVVRNVTRADDVDFVLDDDAREMVTHCNQLDVMLYHAVNERLDCEIAKAGTGFARSLERFRRLNRFYQGVDSHRIQYQRRLFNLIGVRSNPSPTRS